jgi:hypothetical protein
MLPDMCCALETSKTYNFHKPNVIRTILIENVLADENYRLNVIILMAYLMYCGYNRAICIEMLKLKRNLNF